MPAKRPWVTARQLEVLSELDRLTAELGHPPTVRELAARIDCRSTNGVLDHFRALERRGLVEWRKGATRGVVISELGFRELARVRGGVATTPARWAALVERLRAELRAGLGPSELLLAARRAAELERAESAQSPLAQTGS